MSARGWPYLSHQSLVHGDIAAGTIECLLEESEEHGDDDDGFEGLAKDEEKDGDGEDVLRHVDSDLPLAPYCHGKEDRLR